MIKRFVTSLFTSSLLVSGVSAQVIMLPVIREDLRKDAYSVVRLSETEIEYISQSVATEKNLSVVSILDNRGKEDGYFICYCDDFTELKRFSGEIYDSLGKLVRKLKKSDLSQTGYDKEFASGSTQHFYILPAGLKYPLTVKYEWETRKKDGLISFPAFLPQTSFNQAVDSATCILRYPASSKCSYAVVNEGINVTEREVGDKKEIFMSTSRLPAHNLESFGLSFSDLMPRCYLKPNDFVFSGTSGNLDNWQTFGEWQYGLIKSRNDLPEQAVTKIREMTASCSTDREKVKVLYDYLGKTTRYVSIQLGIGGLQPYPASEVYRTGFGDCKGLTNYMKSMLDAIGIPSVYTVISTRNKNLLPDFASANQMNHVILQVPLPNDTLWLECTNPKLPFGYVTSDYAGHNAILITEQGGKLVRLPVYPAEAHREHYIASIRVDEEGYGKASVKRQSMGAQYESRWYFTDLPELKQKEVLNRSINLPGPKILSLNYTADKGSEPVLAVNYEADLGLYGSKTGNRIFMPVNIFRKLSYSIEDKRERKQPIDISFGFVDSDTIRIEMPDGYIVESLPQDILHESEFGTFTSSIRQEDTLLTVIQSVFIKADRYPADKVKEFNEFAGVITKAYKNRVVLKKE